MAQLMRTSNPVLNQKRFEDVAVRGGGMTIDGTVNKTGVLLVCAIVPQPGPGISLIRRIRQPLYSPGSGWEPLADSSARW